MNIDYDPHEAFETMFAKPPVYRQQKRPTRPGVLAILEQVTSASYNTDQSRDELPLNEHYYAAWNAGWLLSLDRRWSGGAPYRRHRISAKGLVALEALREYERIPYDEYSAEWLGALARADAQQAERERIKRALVERMQHLDGTYAPETTLLFKWLITHYAIYADSQPFKVAVDGPFIKITFSQAIKFARNAVYLDECLTDTQAARICGLARNFFDVGRIGKEVAQDGPAMERPYRYDERDGWQVEHTERYAGSNFKQWFMARGIVISAHEAAAVAAQEARA